MKILFSSISIKDKPSGIFNRAFTIARGMVAKGHQVTLFTISNTPVLFYNIEVREGVKIVAFTNLWGDKFGKFGYSVLGILSRFMYAIVRKYDVVHSDMHRPLSSFPCMMYRFFRRKTKYFTDWQDLFGKTGIYDTKAKFWKYTVGPFDNWLEHYNVKTANCVIPFSELLKSKAKMLGKKEDELLKLWGGSDVNQIQFHKTPKSNRKHFGIDENAFIIIYAAMHKLDYESHRAFFLAIKKLSDSGVNIQLVRTGKPFDNKYRNENNIGNEIYDAGYIEYARYGDFLSCADCFVLLQEPTNNVLAKWPNVVGDYLAAGRPIIACVVGELFFLSDSYPYTLLSVTHGSTSDYVEYLTSFLKIDNIDGKYQKIRELAENEFSWDKRATDLLNFYKIDENSN